MAREKKFKSRMMMQVIGGFEIFSVDMVVL